MLAETGLADFKDPDYKTNLLKSGQLYIDPADNKTIPPEPPIGGSGGF